MAKIKDYFNEFLSIFYNPIKISYEANISESRDSILFKEIKRNTLTGKIETREGEVMTVIFSKEEAEILQNLID